VRVVFDTNTVVSALLFEHGRLSWLREHWRRDDVAVLVSRPTVEELIRVLAYPKFALDRSEIDALLADYLPFTEPVVVAPQARAPKCRDKDDRMFVEKRALIPFLRHLHERYFLKTSTLFCPPKAKEFDITTFSCFSRATCGT
jgi:putative PIN family toxin of toxin-antitoxin system